MQATYQGIGPVDRVGPGGQATPSGNPDVHITLTGLASQPTNVRVAAFNNQGTWNHPFNNVNWVMAMDYAAGAAEIYFEPFSSPPSYDVTVTYAGGATDNITVPTGAPPVPSGYASGSYVQHSQAGNITYPILMNLPPARPSPADQISQLIIDTGPYGIVVVGTPPWHQVEWRNNGADFKVTACALSIWTDRGGVCDVAVFATRISDKSIIHRVGWDHYAEPNLPKQVVRKRMNSHFLIAHDDGIYLDFFALRGSNWPTNGAVNCQHDCEIEGVYA